MYVIIVYDIKEDRIRTEVKEFLDRFLEHVQKSVFEGEIPESYIYRIKKELEKLINPATDYVIIYTLLSKNSIRYKIELGKKREDVKIL